MNDLKRLKPDRLVLIGASTGGPVHIEKILSSLPANFQAAIIIAQHMNDAFVPSFIKRLHEHVPMGVHALGEGIKVQAGSVYIATGRVDIGLIETDHLYCRCVSPVADHYNPDIDYLFNAFAPYVPDIATMAIILTGIGADGTNGCMALSKKGVCCIAESESSAIVYGMPQRAKEMVEGILVQSLEKIIESIREFAK